MSCEICKDTNALLSASFSCGDKLYFADVRYDLDSDEHNELDMEVGYVTYDEKRVVRGVFAEWSSSFNTNYCPYCGRKHLNQQEDLSLDNYEHDPNNKDRYIIVMQDYSNSFYEGEKRVYVKVEGILYLNLKDKRLEIELYVDDKLVNVSYFYINFNPVTGVTLEEVDNELVGAICDIVEDFISDNVEYITKSAEDTCGETTCLEKDKYNVLYREITNIIGEWKRDNGKYCKTV